MLLSTTVGFCGDVVCQTIYEPWTQSRPPLTRERLPLESVNSPFLFEVNSPFLYAKQWLASARASLDEQTATITENDKARGEGKREGATPSPAEECTTVLLDLRRSLIFCSFTCWFGVPYFLWVYHHLDRIINPHQITKRNAIAKGFMSYVMAQLTNPIYLTYVTAMDHFFIYRDGRDGRRRVMAIPMSQTSATGRDRLVVAGENDLSSVESGGLKSDRGLFRFAFNPFRNTSKELDQTTIHKMGYYYRMVDNPAFNLHEYVTCVSTDVKRKLMYDFPDIMKYGLVFWSLNWLPMFYYIPGHFRLAYSSCVQLVWSGIMSHMLHRWKKMDGEDNRFPHHQRHG